MAEIRRERPLPGQPDAPLAWPEITLKGRTRRLHCRHANGRNGRVAPVAAHSGDRLLSEPTARAQPCPAGTVLHAPKLPSAVVDLNGSEGWFADLPDLPGPRGPHPDSGHYCLNPLPLALRFSAVADRLIGQSLSVPQEIGSPRLPSIATPRWPGGRPYLPIAGPTKRYNP